MLLRLKSTGLVDCRCENAGTLDDDDIYLVSAERENLSVITRMKYRNITARIIYSMKKRAIIDMLLK